MCLGFGGVGLLDDLQSSYPWRLTRMPRRYPPEFRKVLDLVAAGRPVAQVLADLQISDQVIYL